MAVSNPAKLTSIKQEFTGPNDFKQYNRGGPYVPMNAASQISTTQNGLAISQFSGVSKPAPPPSPPPTGQLVATNVGYSETHVSVITLSVTIYPAGTVTAKGIYPNENWFITPAGASAGPLEINGPGTSGWVSFTTAKSVYRTLSAQQSGSASGSWQVRKAGQPGTTVTVSGNAYSHSEAWQ